MKSGNSEYLVLALVVLVSDQVTKCFIRKIVGPFDIIHVLPVLNIVNIQNWASAFGLFGFLGHIFFIFIAALASVFIAVIIVEGHENRTAFSLILGGTLGNLTDRIIYGRVFDVLDFHAGKYHLPAFNLADAALIVGIVMLMFQTVVQLWARRHD